MKTMKCNKMYIEAMCSMPSSSEAQNQSIRKKIEEGLQLEDCIIKVEKDQVVCRAIIYKDMQYVGYVTVEDIAQNEVDDFIEEVCSLLDTSKEWCSDLYSDKVHFDKIRNALKAQFDTELKRESYTCKTSKQEISDPAFKHAMSFSKEEVLQLMMRATSTTLDTTIQHDQKQKGLYACVEDMYNGMIKRTNEDLFQILFEEETAVGFIVVEQLSKDVGAIGYIGVDPCFQGKHYGKLLVEKALDMAFIQGIHTLIADIDMENFAIRNHLHSTGFKKDCNQHIFTRYKR